MKTATRYVADIANSMENALRQMQPAPALARRAELPNTTQEVTRYVEQLLTADEQSVCDIAAD